MQIDHDPRELSRTALKAVGWATVIVTAAIMLAFATGMRWAVDALPIRVVDIGGGLMFGVFLGFKLGWWDRGRHLRNAGTEE